MSNERLRSRIAEAGMTLHELAAVVQVDPKTIERWISPGRPPHRTNRWAVAAALSTDEAFLWPETVNDRRSLSASAAELVTLYPNRGAVPTELWCGMVQRATEAFDLLVYAGLFWFDAHPDLVDTLAARARAGVRVRLALGDPDSPAVARRGAEEGIDMPARVRMTLGLVRPLLDVAGIEVRLHDTTLYASMYRSDTTMLVNPHAFGSPAAQSPVLHLQRVPGGRLFDHYLRSCDRAWDLGRPIT